MRCKKNKKHIVIISITILIVTILGFSTKFYYGPYYSWVHNSLGGVFYEIFWVLILYLFKPDIKPAVICLIIFLITALLEFSQLLTNPALNLIRKSFIGRSIIGNSFNWFDFLYYINGIIIAYIFIFLMKKKIKA